MKPAIAGNPWVQKRGRNEFKKELKAVGSKWTNAVAIRTTVPKCLEKKRKCRGMGNPGNRRAKIGNEHAIAEDVSFVTLQNI